MLSRLRAVLTFDRPIDNDIHRIIPGGFTVNFTDDRILSFDFLIYNGDIVPDEPTKLWIDLRRPDLDYVHSLEHFTAKDFQTKLVGFEDFYVDTEGGIDTKIHLMEINDCVLEFVEEADDIIEVNITKEKLPNFEPDELER